MGKRPRIVREGAMGEIVKDEMSFDKNLCSDKARQIELLEEKISFDLWYDKHYLDRAQHGDENGKRDGIEMDAVKKLVSEGLLHLLFYCAKVKGFSFLNHEHPKGERALRIVLQDSYTQSPSLNIIIEIHYVSFNKYEITVKTALCKDIFEFSDGQYAVELFDSGSSRLKLMDRGKVREIYICQN
jgi:hypothetical protein